MRFIADEDFPRTSILRLRESGFDIDSVAELLRGATDLEVLRVAHEQDRILLTFDRDFGRLLFKHLEVKPAGVIYFRFCPGSPFELAERLETLVALPDLELAGMFTVVARDHVRQRPLPLPEPR